MYGTFDYAWDALKRDETGKEALNAGRAFPLCSDINHVSMVALEEEELKTLFYDELWIASGANYLPLGLDYLIFDCSYRFSRRTSITWLQLALGKDPSGALGTAGWLGRGASFDGALEFIDELARRRMRSDPEWVSTKHWLSNRHARVMARARKLQLEPVANAA